MVLIAVLKSLPDIKHLDNFRISILIIFSLENLSDFPGSFHASNFSSYHRHLEYCMRLWVSFKFYKEYYVLVSISLFYQAINQVRVKLQTATYLPFVGCGSNISSVFKLFEAILHVHQPEASVTPGRLSDPVKTLVFGLLFKVRPPTLNNAAVDSIVHTALWGPFLEFSSICEPPLGCT